MIDSKYTCKEHNLRNYPSSDTLYTHHTSSSFSSPAYPRFISLKDDQITEKNK